MNETPTSQLPSYISGAVPNPPQNRAPWYKNTAPTYAGIFLWFVFWQGAVNAPSLGGGLAQGLGVALLGIVLAALICHFLFYLVPGLLGQKTGLPLYIVGTSTFGATGGFVMPGFLMGVLQFGWLGVNVYFSSLAVAEVTGGAKLIMVIWGVLAAFVGLKGIQYVAKVATYLPLIPIAVLLILFVKTVGGIGSFDPKALVETQQTLLFPASPDSPMSATMVIAFLLTYIVGFFATAGAAGVDFGTNSRDSKDVKMGGWVGIVLAIVLTAGLSTMIVAGVHGSSKYKAEVVKAAETAKAAVPQADDKTGRSEEMVEKEAMGAVQNSLYNTPSLISTVLGSKTAKIILFLLAISAFPSACFSSFIAANSFKTTLPKVNPFISVGIGAAVSIALALSGKAGDAVGVFKIIGASFGPICGAMMVDYFINGSQWSGPRAGFNPAGWIAWACGFTVGIYEMLPRIGMPIPAAPVAAFIVGAVVYFICAKIGLQTRVVPLPARKSAAAQQVV